MKSDEPVTLDDVAVHALSNHLAVIHGFVELMLEDTPVDHPRRGDLLEIRRAAAAAMQLIGKSVP